MDKSLKSGNYPMISIIIATYNSEKYLEQCIMSVLSQSYSNFELLVIDGGSTDNTVSIVKRYDDSVSYWISEPDNGIYDAWNKAVQRANGQWLVFLGSDDVLYPTALDTYMTHINNHSNKHNLEFISSKIDFVDESLNLIEVVGRPWTWNEFKKSMITWHVGCFHSKSLFYKYGLFDPTYEISGDYEFLLRARDLLITSYINERTVIMRNGGVSSTKLIQASEETYKAKVQNKIISVNKGNILITVDKLRLLIRKKLG